MRTYPAIPRLIQRYRGDGGEVLALLFQLARQLHTAVDRQCAELDLTSQQGAVLLRACASGRVNPNKLADAIGTDSAGMTRLVDRLEAKGLVVRRRSPSDRRAVDIEATAAGRALAPRVGAILTNVPRRMLGGFSAAEVSLLRQMLERVAAETRTIVDDREFGARGVGRS